MSVVGVPGIANTAALVRIETKAKITAADVTGHQDQDAAAEKLLSRLEGTRND